MPNQHTESQRIKCKCETCGVDIAVMPSQYHRQKHHYCSCDCYNEYKRVKRDANIEIVKANLLNLGYEETAKLLGCSGETLKRKTAAWRAIGVDLPYIHIYNVGEILVREFKGHPTKYIKTENGVKYLERIVKKGRKPKEAKKPRSPKQKKPKPIKKEAVHRVTMRKTPKPEVKKFATREIDMSQYKYVRVDSKTLVLKKIA